MKADSVLMAASSCEKRNSQCLICHPTPHSVSNTSCRPGPRGLFGTSSEEATGRGNQPINPSSARQQTTEAGAEKERQERRKRAMGPPAAAKNTEEEKKEDTTRHAAKESSSSNNHLTRSTRQRLSLPQPLHPRDAAPVAKSTLAKSNRKRTTVTKTGKRQASVGEPARNKGLEIPQIFFDNRSEDEEDAQGDSSEEELEAPSMLDAGRNINASGRPAPEEEEPAKDHNANACKRRGKKRRFVLAKQRPISRARLKTASGQVVNFSALKPISATCSRSGMGLVVTYRPVFAESMTVAKRRIRRKPSVNHSAVNSANNNIQPPTTVKDMGTSPRTPSPQKEGKREDSKSPSFFDQIKSVIRRQRDTPKAKEVDKWLEGIPQSSSPRVRKHRSPSPTKIAKSSAKKGDLTKTCVHAKHAARKSPIPGPSWSPEEFRQPFSRSRSPYYMPGRRDSPSPRRPRAPRNGPPLPESLKARSAKAKSTLEEVYDDGRSRSTTPRRPAGRRARSPVSPSAFSRTNSEGWNVTPPPRKRSSPRRRDKDQKPSRDAAASASKGSRRRQHRVTGSRSRASSAMTSSLSESASRAGLKDRGHRGKRHRHSRHRRHHDDIPGHGEEASTGGGTCVVM